MRYVIRLNSEDGQQGPVKVLPEEIHRWLFFTLASVSPGYASEVHDKGMTVGTICFKPYVFSRLYSTRQGHGLKVSSQDAMFTSIFMKALSRGAPNLMTSAGIFEYSGFTIREFANTRRFFTLSPIVLKDADGYVDPAGDVAVEVVDAHLKRKYKSVYGEESSGRITRFKFSAPKRTMVRYKDHMLKGTIGEFAMEGDRELLRIAYEMGIGINNGAGFGMIESCGVY
jgi:CRISPR-associated endoribonuclease Cas6